MKRKIISILLCYMVLFTFLFTGCKATPQPLSKTGFYFDTVITITLYDKNAQKHIDECFSLAEHYENMLSATKEQSDIWKINHGNGSFVAVSPETLSLIQEGIDYSASSNGTFDITVGNLSSLWDFSSSTSAIPSQTEILDALDTVDYKQIQIKNNMVALTSGGAIDLGGIAKGFIADKMKAYLLKEGITSGLINLGGNVLAVGPKDDTPSSYHIAIQKPFSTTGEAATDIFITDSSVVTSGTYQRYRMEQDTLYHHILDLKTGYPMHNGLDSVTIISKTSIEGDALSTCVFLMGLEQGLNYIESKNELEAIFITDDGKIHYSSGIKKGGTL